MLHLGQEAVVRRLKGRGVERRRPGLQLSREAVEAITAYRWPGNVRELRNAIERATVLSRGDLITREDLPDLIFQPALAVPHSASEASLDEIEEEHIRRVLANATTLEEAADTLGISVATLWRKRKRYHMD